jgi:DNA primase large subunit
MDYVPSAKELSHFPFLKKSSEFIKDLFPSLEILLHAEKGKYLTDLALTRINQALSPKKTINPHFQVRDEDEIAGYVLSRLIVSCINDKQLIDRLTRYEAERAYVFLHSETGSEDEKGWNDNTRIDDHGYSPVSKYLADEFRIDITADRIPLVDYVELVSPLHDSRFKLVNRKIRKGFVEIRREERYELLRERIRVILRRDLPYKVPKSVCEHLMPVTEKIKADYQQQMLQQFGAIEESAFPPCIQALISALTAGTNLTHAGRFSLTTFLHAIGMDVAGIAGLYGRSPDFDIEKTMYQVEHITGRGGSGTEYNTPACAAMQTTGLCVHSAALCEKIGHPLSYYKLKKRDVEKKARETRDKIPKSSP